jgi:hypothetical protein
MGHTGAPCTKLAWQGCCYVKGGWNRKLPKSDRCYKKRAGMREGAFKEIADPQE